MKNLKKISVLTGLALGAFALTAMANWTAPLRNPPTCLTTEPGCDGPINTGPSSQTKTGGILTLLGSLNTSGLGIFSSNFVFNPGGTTPIVPGQVLSAIDATGTIGWVNSPVAVKKITAGSNITIDPPSGVGEVTINALSGGSSGTSFGHRGDGRYGHYTLCGVTIDNYTIPANETFTPCGGKDGFYTCGPNYYVSGITNYGDAYGSNNGPICSPINPTPQYTIKVFGGSNWGANTPITDSVPGNSAKQLFGGDDASVLHYCISKGFTTQLGSALQDLTNSVAVYLWDSGTASWKTVQGNDSYLVGVICAK